MGYFSNGTQGMEYEEKHCSGCIHQRRPNGESGCAVWLAHLMYNSDGCDNKESILHLLIPRTESQLDNEKCAMFHSAESKHDRRKP